jgi:hypothetical protein
MFSHGLTHRLLYLALSGDAELFEQLSDARVEDVLFHRVPLRSLGYLSLAALKRLENVGVIEALRKAHDSDVGERVWSLIRKRRK